MSLSILLTVIVLACYGNIITGPFLFDDEHFIEKNEYVKNLEIAKIYSSSVTEGAKIESNFYRPNQQLAFAILYKTFGDNASWFHLYSILIHLMNCIALLLFLRSLQIDPLVSGVTAVLYSCHPILTESVSYISGLSDPLGFLFVLLCLFSAVKAVTKNSGLWIPFALVLQIIALFSKENMVITAPLMLLTFLYLYLASIKMDKKIAIYLLTGSIFLSGGYLILKFSVFNFTDVKGLTDQTNLYTENILFRLNTFIHILGEYFKMIFWPKHIYYEKPYTCYTEIFWSKAVYGILSLGVLIFFIVKAKKYPLFFFSLSWFFIGLIPYSGLIPLNAMFLEHWLYIPIIGVILFCVNFITMQIPSKYVVIIVSVLVISLGVRTNARNSEWGDVEKFYLNELKYTKRSSRIYNNLAMYYADKKEIKRSIKYYRLAIKTNDTYAETHYNLAGALQEIGDFKGALEELYRSLMINPNFIYAFPRAHEIFTELKYYENAYIAYQYYEQVKKGKKISYEELNKLFTIKEG